MKKEKLLALIIDHTALMRGMLQKISAEIDYVHSVLQAGTYAESLRLLNLLRPDAVVYGGSLESPNSMALKSAINKNFRRVIVIAITGQFALTD
ncbi:MAG: hypothetical protein SFU87_09760 [Chitinophagaceae bacterium]|nr:hypothetical protein [Chitinophagaceae bacterium]